MTSVRLLYLLVAVQLGWTQLVTHTKQSFDLPSLIIFPTQMYLSRKAPNSLSCQISAGWSQSTLHDVKWVKDGDLIDEKHELFNEVVIDGPTMVLNSSRQQAEGEYQCYGNLVGVIISNNQRVNTSLISPPIKLRRARITKFDRVSEIIIKAVQSEVARLPCAGLPDVVPGPPEIYFEKEGNPMLLGVTGFGSTNQSAPFEGRYLSTTSGMQIAMVQPEDAGAYYCIVRNDYSNITRRSPKEVILLVKSAEENSRELKPLLVYPTKKVNTPERPIVVDVVAGNTALLECVFTNAKVVWNKVNAELPLVSLTDNRERLQQIWGNLRLTNVSLLDNGLYSCHGLDPLDNDAIINNGEPVVYYQLVVHAQSSVDLTVSQNPTDRSWQISCLANNLRYEIPMVYINATALIDAVDAMGVATGSNFYTNPINVTMRAIGSFVGSVQCVSRPAMEEAEIYGTGLERGRSKQYYVIGGVEDMASLIAHGPKNTTVYEGQNVDLMCTIIRFKTKQWMKDGKILPYNYRRFTFSGSNTVTIKNATISDEGWYSCVVFGYDNREYKASAYVQVMSRDGNYTGFLNGTSTAMPVLLPKKKLEMPTIEEVQGFVAGSDVRLQWRVKGDPISIARIVLFTVQQMEEGESTWTDVDKVEGYRKAATIQALTPKKRYKFRVIAMRDDHVTTTSAETEMLTISMPLRDVLSPPPKIEEFVVLSPTSARVRWSHKVHANAAAKLFYMSSSNNSTGETILSKIDANLSEFTFNALIPNTTYHVGIFAENNAGRSKISEIVVIRTPVPMENGLFDLLGRGAAEIAKAWDAKMVVIIAVIFILLCIAALTCCIICYNVKQNKSSKMVKAANGKFLDTSYRIFNEQKVQKSKIGQRNYDGGTMKGLYSMEMISEGMPLRGNNNDDLTSLHSHKSFHFRRDGTLPNVYGMAHDDDGEPDAYAPPTDPYGFHNNGTLYAATTARCYSADTGQSREVLVPCPPPLAPSILNPSPHKITAYKCADSLLYSPAGTTSSIADTNSSGIAVTRTTADSPTQPLTDGSDQGIRCGSSRNSQISSNEGNNKFLQTFKNNTIKGPPPILSTFDARNFD